VHRRAARTAVLSRKGASYDIPHPQTIHTDVLPKRDAPYNEVAMIQLTPDDQGYPLQQALLSYLDSRRKALRLYGEAVDSGDDAVAEQAKAAAQDASRALEELKKLSASNH
jgi:hypothetical protein